MQRLADAAAYTPMSGFALARELTSRADQSIRSLFDAGGLKTENRWSIVALGGYGRQELCPFSDLDVLFLLDKKLAAHKVEESLKEMLYPLWDSGLDVSYSVRTVKEVVHDARTDFFFHTSLLDARHVCGSVQIYRKCAQALASDRSFNDVTRFVSGLAFHTRKRHDRFGDTAYFLEPHIKDGRGGLRDHQSVVWIERFLRDGRCRRIAPIIGPADRRDLCEAADFMLKTRCTLHGITGRKTDRMHLEYQEELAVRMGYISRKGESAVEGFLRDFHLGAAAVGTVLDMLLRFLDRPRDIRLFSNRRKNDGLFILDSGLLSFSRPDELKDRPLLVMSAFLKMARENLYLAPGAHAQIKGLTRYDTELRLSPAGCTGLLRLLPTPGAENTLVSMLETGVLEQLAPEFSAIRGRTIFDVYHTHTVDMHSIHTVGALHALESGEETAFARVSDLEVLYFSALFHDIGKGYAGPHVDSGAKIVRSMSGRFGFDQARTELAVFLVKNHLIMPDLAFRRDLGEEEVISGLARLAATPERLSMLYLLSMADSRATGPEAWKEWKASLVRELYARTLGFLEKGIFSNPENTMRLEEKWRRLIEAAEGDDKISGRLWALPQAYLLASDVRDVRRHLAVSSALSGNDGLRVEAACRRDHILITFIARDRPGLFSTLAGLLTVNRLEIISARIFTWYDGTVVDTFKVIPPWPDWRKWGDLGRQFADILSGRIDLEDRIGKTRPLCTEPGYGSAPSGDGLSFALDNESSDFFSIIDVQARRRAGLVHYLSRAISSEGLDIHRAFLTRKSDLFTGVFYVTDKCGEKLWDECRGHAVLRSIRTKVCVS